MQVLQAEYNRRVGIERAQHELVCEPIRQRNTERHEAAAVRREQRRQLEQANNELLLAAEQLHQQRLYEVRLILVHLLLFGRLCALCVAAAAIRIWLNVRRQPSTAGGRTCMNSSAKVLSHRCHFSY